MEAAAVMQNGYFVICFMSFWFADKYKHSMVVIVWPYANATAVYLAGGAALLRASYSFLLVAESCLDWLFQHIEKLTSAISIIIEFMTILILFMF